MVYILYLECQYITYRDYSCVIWWLCKYVNNFSCIPCATLVVQINRDKYSLLSLSQSFWDNKWIKIFRTVSACCIFFNLSWDSCAFLLLWKPLSQNHSHRFWSLCDASGWSWYLPRTLLKLHYALGSRILVEDFFYELESNFTNRASLKCASNSSLYSVAKKTFVLNILSYFWQIREECLRLQGT